MSTYWISSENSKKAVMCFFFFFFTDESLLSNHSIMKVWLLRCFLSDYWKYAMLSNLLKITLTFIYGNLPYLSDQRSLDVCHSKSTWQTVNALTSCLYFRCIFFLHDMQEREQKRNSAPAQGWRRWYSSIFISTFWLLLYNVLTMRIRMR